MFGSSFMRPTALAAAVALGLSGCATIDKTLGDNSSGFACGAGALAGAVIGGAIVAAAGGNGKQIAAGSVAGGAVGCAAGYAYKQRVDRLKAVATQEGLQAQVREIEVVDASTGKKASVGLEAQVQMQEMFPSGSATLTADGTRKLSALAREFASNRGKAEPGKPSKKVLVVGHTDSSGSAELNQRLSEQRARAVGDILASAGIARQDIYYQGAGASRPLADNASDAGRAQNRRVEFVEVDNEQVLVKRVNDERSNAKYLAHGTAAQPKVKAQAPSKKVTVAKTTRAPEPVHNDKAPILPDEPAAAVIVQLDGKGGIDFGGEPVTTTQSALASNITPKSSTFSVISPAYASAPMTSCVGDLPRVEGEVKNLATGATLKDYSTNDFFPGLNGQVWGSKVNGHVATVGPVGILRDNAQVAVAPKMQFISNFASSSKKQSPVYSSVANTYEGETQILYRVFAVDQKKTPVTCMDIVFDKRAGSAVAGEIYYPKQNNAYVAQFKPKLAR
ncbi:OmpA family protein [Pseudomonas sichuanensis]|uniref:OmpA family protein n=1 Tax=Pseudomonas TaxID=286 RepID=UPI00129B6D21|nr:MULTISPECIES: OmpA family protein [Pseudomonas]MDH0729203.1 OmpA family protein [Pseudomonas sichuanensis]MDH1581405.1 OmpA family protein [Pseudomonas sichuanensis]MDH1593875.1 OmpA family protein [Pseudomonas sichuanensis]MDH1600015.1 OmpA family protein [Pseudomonas sichuanensis]MDU9402914.1 OmpA family protein [Pseudomonas sp. zfem004]